MKTSIGILLFVYAGLVSAENIIVNRSISTGRIDIGPNAHTGSIVIDGNRIETSSTTSDQKVDPKVVEAEVNRRLAEAARRVKEQLDRLGARR